MSYTSTTNIPQQLYKFTQTLSKLDENIFVQKANITFPTQDTIPQLNMVGNNVHFQGIIKHPDSLTLTVLEQDGFTILKNIIKWVQQQSINPYSGDYPTNISYKDTLTLKQVNTDESSDGYTYKFIGVFPTKIPGFELSKIEGNIVESFDIDFAVEQMETIME